MPEENESWGQLFDLDIFKRIRERRGKSGGPGGGSGDEKSPRRALIIAGIIVGALALLLLAAYLLSTFYADYLWFKEVEQTGVFWKVITTKIWVFFLFGTVFFAIFFSNLYLARRLTPKYEPTAGASPVELSLAEFRVRAGKWLNRAILALSLAISFLTAWAAAHQWETVLKYFTHSSFGQQDPIFHKDIGYYHFKLPFLRYFTGWLFSTLLATLILTTAAHFLYGAINFSRKEQRFAAHTKAHLSVLAGLILLLQAYRFRLQMFDTLIHRSDTLTGAN